MSTQLQAVSGSPSLETTNTDRSFVKRWKHKNLFDRGFLAVPALFLQHYARLKPHPLTTGEALFVLHLMEFKWDAKEPFPGYKTVAARMGVSDKMTRRYAQSLEAKHYLRRGKRVGRTNLFDLNPLFDALSKAVEQANKKELPASSRKANKGNTYAILEWYESMIESYNLLSDEEKIELAEWDRTKGDGNGKLSKSDWKGWEKYIGKKPE